MSYWLALAEGGYVRAEEVEAIKVDLEQANRWSIYAYTKAGHEYQLAGEYASYNEAKEKTLSVALQLERSDDE